MDTIWHRGDKGVSPKTHSCRHESGGVGIALKMIQVRTSCHSHLSRKHRLCSPHGDGWQSDVYCSKLACRRFPLSGRQGFWRLIKSTPGLSCRRQSWHNLKQIHPGFLNVSSPKMSVGSTTSSQRSNDNPCSGNTPLHAPSPKKAIVVLSPEKVIATSLGMQRALCSLTTFRKMPNCQWGILPYFGKRKQVTYHPNLSYWCFHNSHNELFFYAKFHAETLILLRDM